MHQWLSISTSCAGREPGSDSSLARGWTTPSRLLCLHHDEFCSRFCCSGCRDNNVAVRLACCKRTWSINWQLEKRQQGWGRWNQTAWMLKTELKISKTFTVSPGINLFAKEKKFFDPSHLRERSSALTSTPTRLGSTHHWNFFCRAKRSGCRLIGNILTSAGRALYMGNFDWRDSEGLQG